MNEEEIRLKYLSLKNAEYIEKKSNQKINYATDLLPLPSIPIGSTQRHCYLYMRCSTREQASSYSIETQFIQLTKYCEAHNINILAKFEDAGISGSDMNNRPALNNMIELLQPGIIIISTALSRISRNTVQLLNLIQLIKQKNAELILLDLSMDTSTPLGNVMLTILSCLNQFELEQARERTNNTLSALGEKNKLNYKPTWGYKRVNGELIEKPDEMLVVDMIRSLVKNNPNISINKITSTLNKKGFTNRNQKSFHSTTILSIVQNFDIPVKLHKKIKEKNETILEPEILPQAQLPPPPQITQISIQHLPAPINYQPYSNYQYNIPSYTYN